MVGNAALFGGLRLPDGLCLVQEVGGFFLNIYIIYSAVGSFLSLVQVDSRYEDLCSHKTTCGQLSKPKPDYWLLLTSSL